MLSKSSGPKSPGKLTRPERIKAVLRHFLSQNAPFKTELHHASPFELLVAVILSAQCTDKRVNATTPALFAAFPDPYHMGESTFEQVYPYIKSISYPNSKARYLIRMSQLLVEKYGGKVPRKREELETLPGVGRKTANVIMAEVFEAPVIAVDTHVFRVARRLQLVPFKATGLLAVERALTTGIPAKYRGRAHHWLILHGRYVCKARRPACERCQLRVFCPSVQESA